MDRDKFKLNKSQRMQLKAFVCLLGFFLAIVLLAGKLAGALLGGDREGGEEEPPSQSRVPMVEVLRNVWIVEEDEDGIVVFDESGSVYYGWSPDTASDTQVREQVADVVLTDGLVTGIELKKDKINGRVLSVDEGYVEIEGYGKLALTEDYRGYRLYDSLAACLAEDLCIGYDFADFCLEDGKICAVLMAREEVMEYVRILIKTTDFAGIFHEQPVVTADTSFTVVYGSPDQQKEERYQAGEEVVFSPESVYFQESRVRIIPDVLTGKVMLKSVNRHQGAPSYRGQIELLRAGEKVIVINEVPLEEYLYSVVPSEMPAGYPAEALKAQAVCARTYAYIHMEHAAYPQYGAHMDDSTSYQVYNNISEYGSTTAAVRETYGQLLCGEDGAPVGTYFYSTSCGVGSDAGIWKSESAPTLTYLRGKELSRSAMDLEIAAAAAGGISGGGNDMGERLRDEEAFKEFITSRNEDDFEADEKWYRWSYEVSKIDRQHMLEALQKRYKVNSRLVLTWNGEAYVSEPIEELKKIKNISVEKRGAGGVADELVIETSSQKIKVLSESNIRYVLNDGVSKVVRQDGSSVLNASLLPSGFFVISTGKKNGYVVGYTLTGGGFGHGVGMSQNAAKAMAECGYSAEEILLYFFENCNLRNIYR